MSVNIDRELALENKCRKWTIPFYKKYGFIIREEKGKENEKGDLTLIKDNNIFRVEEKSARYIHPCIPFEIWQDKPEKDKGWVYKIEADLIIYIYWDEKLNNIEPDKIYCIYWPKTFKWFEKNKDKYFHTICDKKGRGETHLVLVPWKYLISIKLVKQTHWGNDLFNDMLPCNNIWYFDDIPWE